MFERLVDIAIINLDRRPDRMKYIHTTIPFVFRDHSYEDADSIYSSRRFSAVDGKNLSNYYNSNPEYRDLLNTIRNQPRVLGEVGCSLSHYSLWHSHSISPNAKYLLVFEDDVMFTEQSYFRFSDTIREIQSLEHTTITTNHPRGNTNDFLWDLMYVGGQWTPNYAIDSNNAYFNYQRVTRESLDTYYSNVYSSPIIYKRKNRNSAVIQNDRNIWYTPLFRTAGAYLVSQQGARKLLEAVQTDTALFMKTPLDMWLLEMDFRGYINAYDSLPHPFYQAGFELVKEPAHIENDIHRTKYEIVELD
jgi:GR25 family glycosyltransferase involved in LPS biosynthesis